MNFYLVMAVMFFIVAVLSVAGIIQHVEKEKHNRSAAQFPSTKALKWNQSDITLIKQLKSLHYQYVMIDCNH